MREWSDSIYVANNKIDGVKLAHVCRETTSVHKRRGGRRGNLRNVRYRERHCVVGETKASTKYGTVEKKRG